jgi:hypothetical protein
MAKTFLYGCPYRVKIRPMNLLAADTESGGRQEFPRTNAAPIESFSR